MAELNQHAKFLNILESTNDNNNQQTCPKTRLTNLKKLQETMMLTFND